MTLFFFLIGLWNRELSHYVLGPVFIDHTVLIKKAVSCVTYEIKCVHALTHIFIKLTKLLWCVTPFLSI